MLATGKVEAGKGIISLQGRFDFNRHREFRAASEPLLDNPELTVLQVDLGGVDYLDSSALGMLLVLRDKARALNKQIVLANVRGNVKQVLEIANFGKLFQID